ncbi:MAG: hypothetical protein P8J27_09635 [Mariniblastus sp.]|nr:hypothetical protein [Mariniblastus sp.]
MDKQTQKSLRKKIYINREVQKKLIVQHIMHCCFYMSAILLTVVIWAALRDPSEPIVNYVYQACLYFAPAILASLILLPLFLYDHLKESHRVVGPIHRIKAEMKALAEGGSAKEIRFRKDDHWADLATEFNRLSNAVAEQRLELQRLKIGARSKTPSNFSDEQSKKASFSG